MATKRQILESLSHKDLLSIAEDFELSIDNRRRKGNVVDALVTSRTARLTSVLEGFSLAQLKETCRKLEIKVNGRTKVDFIEGLLGKKAIKVPTATANKAATTARTAKSPVKKTAKAKAKEVDAEPQKANKASAKASVKPKAEVKTKAKAKAKAKPKAEVKAKPKARPKADELKAKPRTELKAKAQPVKPIASPKKQPRITKKANKAKEAKEASAPAPVEAAPQAAEAPNKGAHPTAPDYSRVLRPTPVTGPVKAECIACKTTVQVVHCQANECNAQMVPPVSRKICAGCWFDRSGGSFDLFLTEYKRDTTCPSCEKQWGNFDD